MSLRTAVAVPFRASGTDRLAESAFVVELTMDRKWFSPDQAKQLIDVAASEGLVRREDGELVVTFDTGGVDVPEGFVPDESIIQTRSTFQRVLDTVVEAGETKQDAVAGINRLQREYGITIEAAAVLYAHRLGLDIDEPARRALEEL